MQACTATIAIATSDSHLRQILALQRRYHVSALSTEQQSIEGFVFAEHSMPVLRRMASELPQAIALSGDQVVGYCLSLPLSLQNQVPTLAPMFCQFSLSSYKGKPLSDYRFMVGGQVCVDRGFRGRGLLRQLYHQVARDLPHGYDLCVTEISVRNQVSVRAHQSMGFQIIASYADSHEEWGIFAWDLRGSVADHQ